MVRTPDYFDVYLLAAGQLIERAEHDNRLDEMAVPCFYLQRHTLELAIKELVKRLHRLDYGDVVVKMMREGLDHRAHLPVQVRTIHKLTALVEDLRSLVYRRGYAFPAVLEALARDFDAVEDGDETRSRYPAGKGGKNFEKKYALGSYPEEVVVPLKAWQVRLEAIEADSMHESLREQLCDAAQRQDEELYSLGYFDQE